MDYVERWEGIRSAITAIPEVDPFAVTSQCHFQNLFAELRCFCHGSQNGAIARDSGVQEREASQPDHHWCDEVRNNQSALLPGTPSGNLNVSRERTELFCS